MVQDKIWTNNILKIHIKSMVHATQPGLVPLGSVHHTLYSWDANSSNHHTPKDTKMQRLSETQFVEILKIHGQ